MEISGGIRIHHGKISGWYRIKKTRVPKLAQAKEPKPGAVTPAELDTLTETDPTNTCSPDWPTGDHRDAWRRDLEEAGTSQPSDKNQFREKE
jgi:hypothetical protein